MSSNGFRNGSGAEAVGALALCASPAGRPLMIGGFMDFEEFPDFSWISDFLEEAREEMEIRNLYPVCDE